ncbi:hypothetical protein BC835DRAFT_1302665 [Cytidiella melzeri]|nr:hypothetical protein BC835DRAFT_1302665 [Cytidiella melzeri]
MAAAERAHVHQSASVLFVFDYCLTVGQESNLIWRRKWTIATWLFIVTRYVALLSAGLQFIQNSTISGYVRVPSSSPFREGTILLGRCKGMTITTSTLSVAKFLCFAVLSKHVPSVFSALRVYALLEGNLLVTGVVFVLTLVPAATNIYKSCVTSFMVAPEFEFGFQRCIGYSSVTEKLALGPYRTAQRHGFWAPLVIMLFRDGTLYFIILLIMNVIVVLRNNVLCSKTYTDPQPSWEKYDFASPFLECFTPIIICHFILNLRQLGAHDDDYMSGQQSTIVRFAANLGQSVRFGGWEEDKNTNQTQRFRDSGDIHHPKSESIELGKVEEGMEEGEDVDVHLAGTALPELEHLGRG